MPSSSQRYSFQMLIPLTLLQARPARADGADVEQVPDWVVAARSMPYQHLVQNERYGKNTIRVPCKSPSCDFKARSSAMPIPTLSSRRLIAPQNRLSLRS